MPKTPINYNNTLIFKICPKDLNDKDIFIISSTNLPKLKCLLKKTLSNLPEQPTSDDLKKFIISKGGLQNIEFIKIESFPCSNKYESDARVHFHKQKYHKNNECFDDVITTNNDDDDNVVFTKVKKTSDKEYIKKYYQAHKDKYNKKKKVTV